MRFRFHDEGTVNLGHHRECQNGLLFISLLRASSPIPFFRKLDEGGNENKILDTRKIEFFIGTWSPAEFLRLLVHHLYQEIPEFLSSLPMAQTEISQKEL